MLASLPLSGTVIGALLNDPAQIAALGDAARQPPHKAPPQAPVLEVKPRHTLAGEGAQVQVPAGVDALEVGCSLGLVVGRTACRVKVEDALRHVAGYLIAGDLSLPLDSHYRPAVRFKARDGYCPLGAAVSASTVPDPSALVLDVFIDGQLAQRCPAAGRTRSAAQLLAEVSGFMTLRPGDVLLLGRSHGVPLARAGQRVAIRCAGLGELNFQLVEAAA